MKGLGEINLMQLEFHNGEPIAWDRNHSVTGQYYMTSNNRYTVGSTTSVLLDDWYRMFVPVRDVVSSEEIDCFYNDPYPCEEGELSDIEELL